MTLPHLRKEDLAATMYVHLTVYFFIFGNGPIPRKLRILGCCEKESTDHIPPIPVACALHYWPGRPVN